MASTFFIGPLVLAHLLVPIYARDLRDGGTTARVVTRGARADVELRVGTSTQKIELAPEIDAARWISSVRLVDVNFDGHPDVVALREWGAKWERFDVYLYDARTRRFANASPLARAVSALDNPTFDVAHHRISAHNIGPSRPSRETYTVSGDHLRLVDGCSFLNDANPHVGTLVRRHAVGERIDSTFTTVRSDGILDPCGL